MRKGLQNYWEKRNKSRKEEINKNKPYHVASTVPHYMDKRKARKKET
jgi:hypothetical protein